MQPEYFYCIVLGLCRKPRNIRHDVDDGRGFARLAQVNDLRLVGTEFGAMQRRKSRQSTVHLCQCLAIQLIGIGSKQNGDVIDVASDDQVEKLEDGHIGPAL